MKKYIAGLLLLFIVGCSTGNKTLVTEYKTIVIEPPSIFYECEDLPELPSGDYTQRDVAKLIASLYEVGIDCKQALARVKQYIEDSKKIILEEEGGTE